MSAPFAIFTIKSTGIYTNIYFFDVSIFHRNMACVHSLVTWCKASVIVNKDQKFTGLWSGDIEWMAVCESAVCESAVV